MTKAEDIRGVYLQSVQLVRGSGSGVDKLLYCPALDTLFSAVGKTLKLNVRPVMNLNNRGAGLPDGGLFTPDQVGRKVSDERALGQVSARGAIVVKGTGDDIDELASREHVRRYLAVKASTYDWPGGAGKP